MEKENRSYYKNLPFFLRDSVPYPDRGMIPLYPHLQKHEMFLRYRGKDAVPPRQGGGEAVFPKGRYFDRMPLWGIGVRTAEQMRRLPEGQGLKTLLEQSLKKIKYSSYRSRNSSAGNHCRANLS